MARLVVGEDDDDSLPSAGHTVVEAADGEAVIEQVGITAILRKPFTARELLVCLETVLAAGKPAGTT